MSPDGPPPREWRSRIRTPLARLLGVKAHAVIFRHRDDPGGPGRVVGIEIPEVPARLIAEALELARAMKARIFIVADTAAQAEAMAAHIGITCGQHERVPYERATAGEFRPVS
jgi:hypothetical protein